VIAHGMSVVALVCEEVVARHAGGDAARVRGVGGRFSTPVVPGEPLDVELGAAGEGVVRFSCRTPRGLAVKNGWVELG
jgi:acyl dehydratase